MKKMEAIWQLAGYLSTYHWYEEKYPSELVELAEHAIEGMEKIGMGPPKRLVEKLTSEITGIDKEVGNFTIGQTYSAGWECTWEDE